MRRAVKRTQPCFTGACHGVPNEWHGANRSQAKTRSSHTKALRGKVSE